MTNKCDFGNFSREITVIMNLRKSKSLTLLKLTLRKHNSSSVLSKSYSININTIYSSLLFFDSRIYTFSELNAGKVRASTRMLFQKGGTLINC